MNIKLWVRAGNDYIAMNAHNDVVGILRSLNDGIQRKPPNEPINANESLTERARLIDKKIKTRYERRSELRRRAKGSDPPVKSI